MNLLKNRPNYICLAVIMISVWRNTSSNNLENHVLQGFAQGQLCSELQYHTSRAWGLSTLLSQDHAWCRQKLSCLVGKWLGFLALKLSRDEQSRAAHLHPSSRLRPASLNLMYRAPLPASSAPHQCDSILILLP